MKKIYCSLLLPATALLFAVIPLFANGGYFGKGNIAQGHLVLLKSEDVSIEKETLKIDLYKGFAEVEVEYEMKNHGVEKKIRIGYPCMLFNEKSIKKQEIAGYKIFSNDTQLPVHFVKEKKRISWLKAPVEFMGFSDSEPNLNPKLAWYVSSLEFKKNEVRRVRITYLSCYQGSGSFVSEDTHANPERFMYLLSVGKTWKGPIKKGSVTITAKTVNPGRISIWPGKRFSRKGNVFTWNFRDLEPSGKDNIVVNLMNKYDSYAIYGSSKQGRWDSIYRINNRYYRSHLPDEVRVSSFLRSTKYDFSSKSLFDGKTKTSWVEGKKGAGKGEYIVLRFKKPVRISRIGFIAGMNYSHTLFGQNNRPSAVRIILNGKHVKRAVLADGFTMSYAGNPHAYQYVSLSGYRGSVRTVKIIIDDIYRGTKYHDTCISELIIQENIKKPKGHLGAR